MQKRWYHGIAACVIAGVVSFAHAAVTSDVEYGNVDGVSLKLDAYPPASDAEPGPAVIIVHGGGWSSGDKAKDITPLIDPMNKAGMAVFSINYRMAPKYRWPACFDDTRTAIRWVKAHAAEYHGDPSRVVLVGYSAGGHLVSLAAVTAAKDAPDTQVQAVVGLAPPTDLELDLPQRGGLSQSLQWLVNRPHELTPEARAQLHGMSAINFIHKDLPPFLIVHGNADKSVLFQDSINVQKAIKDAGGTCDLITLEKAPHNIARWPDADPKYVDKIVTWLNEKLVKNAAPKP